MAADPHFGRGAWGGGNHSGTPRKEPRWGSRTPGENGETPRAFTLVVSVLWKGDQKTGPLLIPSEGVLDYAPA